MRRLPKWLAPSLIAALLGGAAMAQSDLFRTMPDPAELSNWRWENRLLFVIGGGQDDAAFDDQIERLRADPSGLRDRDLIVFTDPEGRSALSREFDAEGFAVVLVGKDGGVKRRETAPLALDSLYSTIDAMPMRRREMREDG
jgi:hypothetical protein